MTVLKFGGEKYQLAEGWDAAKVASVLAEARQAARTKPAGEGVPLATIDLAGGRKVVVLVAEGIPLAVEVPNPEPRGAVVIR